MSSRRQTQVAESIAHLAGLFFARESNYESLITVTRADVSPDLKNATVYFSVMPESKEEGVLHFARRNRVEFRDFLKSKSRMKFLPFVDFVIDYGEKHRQHIDELTRKASE